MAVKLTTYDPAEDLTSDEAMATFIAEAFATEDPGYVAHALGVVAGASPCHSDFDRLTVSRLQRRIAS